MLGPSAEQSCRIRHTRVPGSSQGGGIQKGAMSYNLTLQCGCLVYVACDPLTTLAHARILEWRDPGCRVRKHEIGLRLSLWEIVPALVEIGTDDEHRPALTREAAREVVMRGAPGVRRETN